MTDEHPSGERRPISKRLRYEVFRRDDYTCRYCGAGVEEARLTIDHVVPVALGGKSEPDNLKTACVDCNAGKSSVAPDQPIVEGVSDDAIRWAEAMKEAARSLAADETKRKREHTKFNKAWRKWTRTYSDEPFPRPEAWRQSINQFLNAGLEMKVMVDLIDVAMESKADDKWRYFCGCCWRRISDLQDAARALIEVEQAEGEGSE